MIQPIFENEQVVIATGDREWTEIEIVYNALSQFPTNTVFVHGYADGLDCIVDVVASDIGFRVIRCPAHWNHRYYRWIEVYGECLDNCTQVCGKPAGVLRNKYMLDTYLPWTKEVLGFHNNILSSRGTKDMLKRSQKAGLKTTLYNALGEKIENPKLTKERQYRKLKEIPAAELFFNWD
jgi:hypothetical protein